MRPYGACRKCVENSVVTGKLESRDRDLGHKGRRDRASPLMESKQGKDDSSKEPEHRQQISPECTHRQGFTPALY